MLECSDLPLAWWARIDTKSTYAISYQLKTAQSFKAYFLADISSEKNMETHTDSQIVNTQTSARIGSIDANPARKQITIICPVHNEAKVIPLFFERMRPVMAELSKGYDVSLVFSNNASTDKTLEAIESIRREEKNVYVISKNELNL